MLCALGGQYPAAGVEVRYPTEPLFWTFNGPDSFPSSPKAETEKPLDGRETAAFQVLRIGRTLAPQ
ncbi:MAG: hypothetical protein ABIH23_13205 [bacterium]